MLAIEAAIVERLRAALPSAWTVKGMFTDTGKRDPELFASVEFVDSDVPASEAPGALVRPLWAVTLTGKRSDAAVIDLMDAAFALVIEALHGWAPGEPAARRWERLQLRRVKPAYPMETGLVGIELAFTTSARFDGQP